MLLLMTVSKRVSIVSSVILIALLVGACGTVTSTPTTAPTLSAITPTFTLLPIPSAAATPLAINTATPVGSLPVSSSPDGLRMVYRTSQGLYLKDGSNPPRQLTQHNEDYDLRISDDGEKIVFGRRTTPFTLYSINADGGDELALVTRDKLTALNLGYDAFIAKPDDTTFVPGTHLLLFETANFEFPNSDLLSVDTDTGEIKSLLPIGQVADYRVSPDGTKIAVNVIGEPAHIDLIGIDGEILQSKIATYTPSEPIYIAPNIHWKQDSNSLTIVLPYPTFYDTSGGAPNYTVWRYALGEDKSMQVPLDPMPKDLVEVSHDGNWVTYHDDGGALYIGNLRDGSSQVYTPKPLLPLYSWSPDNIHFVYGRRKIYLGALNTSPVFFGDGGFMDWVDASHFLYYNYANKTLVMGGIDGGQSVILTDVDGPLSNTIFTFISLH
jgi:hypothetical protein